MQKWNPLINQVFYERHPKDPTQIRTYRMNWNGFANSTNESYGRFLLMSYYYDRNTDTYHLTEKKSRRKKKTSSLTKGRREIIDKVVASHRKKKSAAEKRADKISDLQSRKDSWKNLE